MTGAATTEAVVRDFLATNFPLGEDARGIDGSSPLLEAGILDSTGVLELVDFLEDRFGITISDDELVPENLNSIDNVVRFLADKRGS
jgi:acyl carrier protein